MDCILKTENESGILGELQDDSDSVKDLSHCPEDMTIIYTDMGRWQGATSCRPYWDNLCHIPTGHISPEDICKRDNDSPSIWICSKLAHPPKKSTDASFTHICIKLVLWGEESRGLDCEPKDVAVTGHRSCPGCQVPWADRVTMWGRHLCSWGPSWGTSHVGHGRPSTRLTWFVWLLWSAVSKAQPGTLLIFCSWFPGSQHPYPSTETYKTLGGFSPHQLTFQFCSFCQDFSLELPSKTAENSHTIYLTCSPPAGLEGTCWAVTHTAAFPWPKWSQNEGLYNQPWGFKECLITPLCHWSHCIYAYIYTHTYI